MGIYPSRLAGSEGHGFSLHRARLPVAPCWARAISQSCQQLLSCSGHQFSNPGVPSLQTMSRPEPSNALLTRVLPHTHARGTTLRPRAGHRHPGTSPSGAQRAATASHLGGHHRTKVGVSLLAPVPGKPRCLCQTHAAHVRATGVTIPTPVTGAPRIPHLPRARVAAAPPPADPSGGPPRALDTAQLPRRLHRARAQGPARRARGPPYLQPAAGLGPPPPPRPPPPSWAPQGPDSLTPLPQGAGAGAKAASAPRGTLRPLRKPHSAASGDHGDGRGAAAPPGAREGSGAEARASGVFRGLRAPRRGGGGRPAPAAAGLRGRPGGAGPAALHAGKGAVWVPLLQAPRDRV